MSNLTELLEGAAGDVRVPSPFDQLDHEATRRRLRRRRRRIAIVTVAALIVAAVVAVGWPRSTTHEQVTTARSSTVTSTALAPTAVFSSPTGDALIFDNGYDSLTDVDLDHRVASRRYAVGERAGDQPFRLTRSGNDLLVGWGEIFATPIAGGASRSVGIATIYIPAVEPDRVWLVDYPNGAGTTPMLQFVEVSTGRVLDDVPSPMIGDACCGLGIPGGLALQTPSGIDLWQLDGQRATGHLGSDGGGQILDARGGRLAWCPTRACNSVHVTDVSDPTHPVDVFAADLPGGDISGARLSPDASRLAVALRDGSSGHVTVIGNGFERDLGDAPQFTGVEWSDDGARLYFVENSFQGRQTSIGLWNTATDDVERTTLPFGGLTQFVVVGSGEIGRVPDQLGAPDNCPVQSASPSAVPSICAFHF